MKMEIMLTILSLLNAIISCFGYPSKVRCFFGWLMAFFGWLSCLILKFQGM